MDREELLYNKLYEKTKYCGRTQFVRLLMDKERKNKQLKDKINKAFQLLQLLHYKFDDNDSIHNDIEDIQKILKDKGSGK